MSSFMSASIGRKFFMSIQALPDLISRHSSHFEPVSDFR